MMHTLSIFHVIVFQVYFLMYCKDLKTSAFSTFKNQTACITVTRETESYTKIIIKNIINKKTDPIFTWGVGKLNLVDAYTNLKTSAISTFENQTACITVIRETESYTIIIKKIINKKTDPILTWGVGKLNLVDAYTSRIKTVADHNNLTFCIMNTSRDDAGTYVWNDSNARSHTVQLNVWYGPAQIMLKPNWTSIAAFDENSSLKINCRADCNPNCTFLWEKDQNVNVSTSSFLLLKNLTKMDKGNYTCIAFNTKDHAYNNSKGFQIYVNYAAQLSLHGRKKVVEYSNVKMTCNVDSYPMSNVSWLRENRELNTTLVTNNEVLLNLPNTTCDDSGIYSCSAFNGIGIPILKNISFEVLCKPRFIGAGEDIKKKVTASIGDKIQMKTQIRANPLPNVLSEDNDFNISFSNLSHSMYDIIMRKKISTVSDFRHYFLIIGNTQGNVTLEIEIEEREVHLGNVYGYIIGIPLCLIILLTISVVVYKDNNIAKCHKGTYNNRHGDAVNSVETGGYRDNILYQSIDSASFQAQGYDFNVQNFDIDEVDEILTDCSAEDKNTKTHSEKLEDESDDVSLNIKLDLNTITTKSVDKIKGRKPLPRPRESKMHMKVPDKVPRTSKQMPSNFGNLTLKELQLECNTSESERSGPFYGRSKITLRNKQQLTLLSEDESIYLANDINSVSSRSRNTDQSVHINSCKEKVVKYPGLKSNYLQINIRQNAEHYVPQIQTLSTEMDCVQTETLYHPDIQRSANHNYFGDIAYGESVSPLDLSGEEDDPNREDDSCQFHDYMNL